MKMSSFMPEDWIIGILLRLPVKSLLRFESVSKSWYAMVTSRNFRYEHLNNNVSAGGGCCLWAQFHSSEIVNEYLPDKDMYFRHRICQIENLHFPDETLADLSRHAFEVPENRPILYGPCNGIFLVTFFPEGRYALWNPATQEFRELPDAGFRDYCFEEYCGFGLDPKTNDYKVVILRNIEHLDYFLVGKVHTLGTEHWKNLELDWQPPNPSPYKSTCHTYLNGVYYFHLWNFTALSFDMATDAIEAIPPPNELEPVYESYPADQCLAVSQGTIALFYISWDNNYLSIWTLNEKSWIKRFNAGLQAEVRFVIGCWNDEILLYSSTNRLLLYKTNTQEIRDVGLNEMDRECIGIHAYRESLISIDEEYECRRLRNSGA